MSGEVLPACARRSLPTQPPRPGLASALRALLASEERLRLERVSSAVTRSTIPASWRSYYAKAMCGIAGKISRSGEVDQSLIERMCNVIEHRGPDSRGVFV